MARLRRNQIEARLLTRTRPRIPATRPRFKLHGSRSKEPPKPSHRVHHSPRSVKGANVPIGGFETYGRATATVRISNGAASGSLHG